MTFQPKSSMYRSGTMPISLPKISKLNIKQHRYSNNSHNITSFQQIALSKARNNASFIQSARSPFTQKIEKQIFDQNQYQYIETSNLQRQQIKLKDLLKQFNEETLGILQKYVIDKPIRKQYVKKKQPIQSLHQLSQKESENSTNMIILLKHQIEVLQSRCQNLKYITKEQMEQKIRQLREQKPKIITQNKQICRQITLNGLQIMKGKESIAKQLEYEQFMIDTKRDRLRKESQSVGGQISQLQSKIKQINSQIQKYEQQESYTLKMYEEIQRQKSQNRLYQQVSKRRKMIEHNRIMNQSMNFQLKHKYFQKLKQLQEYGGREEQNEVRVKDLQVSIVEARTRAGELESKFQGMGNKVKGMEGKGSVETRNAKEYNSGIKINVKLE